MSKKIDIKKLLSYYKPYKKTLFFDLFFDLMKSGLVLGGSFGILKIKDIILSMPKDEAFRMMGIVAVLIPIFCFLIYICNHYMLYHGHMMGAKIERDMRSELFSHYQKLSLEFYDNERVGGLMSRLTSDLNSISEFLHHTPEDLTFFVVRFLGSLVLLFTINKTVAIVTFFIILIILVFSVYYIPKIHNAFVVSRKKNSYINSQVEESLSGIKVIKSFSSENIEIEKFNETNEEFFKSEKDSYRIFSVYHSLVTALISSIIPIIVISSLFFIFNGNMSMDDLITYLVYGDILMGPIYIFMSIVETFQHSVAGYHRFVEALSVQPAICDSKDAVALKEVKGKISFHNVSFNYKSDDDKVFSNFNLTINPKEYVAIVGTSGVGKSTICSLILRFYESSSGTITIDDVDIKKIKSKSLRENIGFVMQDTYLFADTVKANIAYGKKNATDKEIIEAAKKAFAHDFILGLPDGYDTQIGQRGSKLSGGQKQRISIARVFLKDPSILIFDEATSALDLKSEREVQKSMERLSKERTTIVIAHRLSTIKRAQRIIVLSENGVEEEGTHEDLINKKGIYFELSNLVY